MTATLETILPAYGLVIVPTSKRRAAGETHAGGVLRRILREHGVEHLATVLALLRGSSRNRESLSSESIAAVSDVLRARPDWLEPFGDLVEAFEHLDLDGLRERAVSLRPWPVKATLRTWVYLDLRDRLCAADELEMAA